MQQAARTYYHTCPHCKANLDPGERCTCQSPEHRRQEFSAWMDKQMDEYRAAGIPFIGYLWVNYNSRLWGGALYRLDEVTVQDTRFSGLKESKENIAIGTKLKINKTGVSAVMRVIKQLERELGTQVYTYMG